MASFLLLALLRTAAAESHYDVLGVASDAAPDAIRAAFRRIALADHPDKLPPDSAAAVREAAVRRFQRANEAFECLSDPTARQRYDEEIAWGPAAAAAAAANGGVRPPPPPPVVRVPVRATLSSLGGWTAASVDPRAYASAFGQRITREMAERGGLPLKTYLPPGSAAGDLVACPLPAVGVTVAFALSGATPPRWRVAAEAVGLARRQSGWERRGDDLHLTVTLPAWRRGPLRRRVRVRSPSGQLLTLLRRGAAPPPGDEATLAGEGMPRRQRDAASTPLSADRGALRVGFTRRSWGSECRLAATRAAALAAAAATSCATAAASRRLAPAAVRAAHVYASLGADAARALCLLLSRHMLARATPANTQARRREAAGRRRVRVEAR